MPQTNSLTLRNVSAENGFVNTLTCNTIRATRVHVLQPSDDQRQEDGESDITGLIAARPNENVGLEELKNPQDNRDAIATVDLLNRIGILWGLPQILDSQGNLLWRENYAPQGTVDVTTIMGVFNSLFLYSEINTSTIPFYTQNSVNTNATHSLLLGSSALPFAGEVRRENVTGDSVPPDSNALHEVTIPMDLTNWQLERDNLDASPPYLDTSSTGNQLEDFLQARFVAFQNINLVLEFEIPLYPDLSSASSADDDLKVYCYVYKRVVGSSDPWSLHGIVKSDSPANQQLATPQPLYAGPYAIVFVDFIGITQMGVLYDKSKGDNSMEYLVAWSLRLKNSLTGDYTQLLTEEDPNRSVPRAPRVFWLIKDIAPPPP